MKTIRLITCLLCAIIFTSCSRSSSGKYEGTCETLTEGGIVKIDIAINENNNVLTGFLTLSPIRLGSTDVKKRNVLVYEYLKAQSLSDTSDILGKKDGKSISFVTKNTIGEITWSGEIKSYGMRGNYIFKPSSDYIAATKRFRGRDLHDDSPPVLLEGTWEVDKK